MHDHRAISKRLETRRFVDGGFNHYLECGEVAHFLGVSAILFLWLFFICALWISKKQASFYFQLLLPCALLPVMIGLFGSSLGWYGMLDFSPPFGSEVSYRSAGALLPLIAGSCLSACFLFLSLVILFIQGSTLAKQQLMLGTRPDESR